MRIQEDDPNHANQVLGGTGVDFLVPAATATTVEVMLGADGNADGTADDPGLINGVECTYRVRANVYVDANGSGTQDASEPTIGKWVEGKATPMPTTAGDPPTDTPTRITDFNTPPAEPTTAADAPINVSAVAGQPVMQVSWKAVHPTRQGNGPYTGYRVTLFSPAQAPPALSVPVASVTVSANTETRTFTGLTNGWNYTAVVQALNTKGASSPGTVVNGESLTQTPGAESRCANQPEDHARRHTRHDLEGRLDRSSFKQGHTISGQLRLAEAHLSHRVRTSR